MRYTQNHRQVGFDESKIAVKKSLDKSGNYLKNCFEEVAIVSGFLTNYKCKWIKDLYIPETEKDKTLSK